MKKLFLVLAVIINNISVAQVITEEAQLDMLMASSFRTYKHVNFDSLVTVTINKINQFRVKNNLNTLTPDKGLNSYSKSWSDVCLASQVKHSDIVANGIKAENIHFSMAFGAWIFGNDLFYTIPNDIFTGWLNSPGHKKNMLTNNVTKIGLSISTYFDGNDYKLVSVMVVQ